MGCAPEKWAPTLEFPPQLNILFSFASVCLLFMLCFPLEYFLYAFYTGQQFYKLVSQSIFWLLMSSAKKNAIKNFMRVSRGMFTCEMFQVCNHSVLISCLGMGFGHRNCVVVGCPNSGKWAKQTCTVHACLNGTHTCDCEPPFKLFPFPTEKKDSEGRRRWKENIKREKRKGKVWTPKNSSRVCSVHFKDGQPTNENPDPTEDLGYNVNFKVVGGKRKNPLDRSKIIPEKKPRKAKKSGEEVSEVLVEQEIPNHSDTCVSEITGTAPETTANAGNCSTAPEAEFFVNNCCPEKDLRIQELQEQLKKAENELKILKEKLEKVEEKKGLKCGDLKTDKEVNLLTGIPSRVSIWCVIWYGQEKCKEIKILDWSCEVNTERQKFQEKSEEVWPKKGTYRKRWIFIDYHETSS